MKQYRHKSTGNIAVKTHSGNNYRVTVPQKLHSSKMDC